MVKRRELAKIDKLELHETEHLLKSLDYSIRKTSRAKWKVRRIAFSVAHMSNKKHGSLVSGLLRLIEEAIDELNTAKSKTREIGALAKSFLKRLKSASFNEEPFKEEELSIIRSVTDIERTIDYWIGFLTNINGKVKEDWEGKLSGKLKYAANELKSIRSDVLLVLGFEIRLRKILAKS